jgi:hypothetical protein
MTIAPNHGLIFSCRNVVFTALLFGFVSNQPYAQCMGQTESLREVIEHLRNIPQPTQIEATEVRHYDRSLMKSRLARIRERILIVEESTESDGRFKSEVYVRSRNHIFTATRASVDKAWLLTDFGRPDDPELAKSIDRSWHSSQSLLDFRSSISGVSIAELLERPDIVEAKAEPSANDLLLMELKIKKPEAVLPGNDSPIRFTSAKIFLDPKNQYCPSVIELFYPTKGSIYTHKVEKWDEVGGQKYPKQWLVSSDKFGDLYTVEVTSIRFDEVPESEFTLEAFGIPNPYDNAPTDTLWSPTLIMAIAGVAFLAVGFAFRFAKRQGQAS